MLATILKRRLCAALALLAIAGFQVPAMAETPVGSNVDSRVIVAVNAPSEGVQALMPDGWTSMAFPGGPLGGANFLMIFIDNYVQYDADGNATSPSNRRLVAMAGLARQAEGQPPRLFVLDTYTTVPEDDPYGVNDGAEIDRASSVSGPANGGREHSDMWTITAEGGGALTLELGYSSGNANWMPGEAFPYSSINPEFSRIYRFEQLVDLVASSALGISGRGEVELTNSIPALSGILDGTEEIMAVMDVPVYVRQISLP